MISRPDKPQGILSLGWYGEKKRENRTEWDFKLRREVNRFTDLNYAIRRRIIKEALQMEDQNGWKRLNLHVLARLARARLADLPWLGLQDACESAFDGMH
jgi:hypothetical protein